MCNSGLIALSHWPQAGMSSSKLTSFSQASIFFFFKLVVFIPLMLPEVAAYGVVDYPRLIHRYLFVLSGSSSVHTVHLQ